MLGWTQGVASAADEAAPGALVTRVQGAVRWSPEPGSPAKPLEAFVRLFGRAVVSVPPEASLQLIYLRSGRQENWTGPAAVTVGEDASAGSGGATPSVKALPPVMLAGLSRGARTAVDLRERQAMTRMRAVPASPELQEAQAEYTRLRAAAAEDDIAPELYLIGRLDALNAPPGWLRQPVEEMVRRQPYNPRAAELQAELLRRLPPGSGKPEE